MAKRNFGDEFGFQTRAVHTGNDVDSETGAIKRPITMANSYELPYDPSDLNWSSAGKNLYTRNGGSNQQYLQEKLASLEGGEDCVVLASGVAALSGLFFALLKSGDHVVFSSVTYIAVYRLLNELLKDKFGVCGRLPAIHAWLYLRRNGQQGRQQDRQRKRAVLRKEHIP